MDEAQIRRRCRHLTVHPRILPLQYIAVDPAVSFNGLPAYFNASPARSAQTGGPNRAVERESEPEMRSKQKYAMCDPHLGPEPRQTAATARSVHDTAPVTGSHVGCGLRTRFAH